MADVSITSRGARPGQDNAAATRSAIEKAIDAAASSGGCIFIPQDHQGYWLDRPVPLAPTKWASSLMLFLRGDPAGGSRLCAIGGFPPLVLGFQHQPGYLDGTGRQQVWGKSHYVESFGVLDSGAAPKAGVRFGLNTANDTVYSFPSSPLNHGPRSEGWSKVRVLTIDVAYRAEPTSKRKPSPDAGGVQVFGVSPKGVPRPFYVSLDPDGVQRITFGTTGPGSPSYVLPETRTFRIPTEGEGLLRRFSCEIDLDRSEIRAWAGGRRVKVQAAATDWGQPLVFADNTVTPFKLGALGDQFSGWQDNFGGPVDYTFFGLRLGSGARYKDGPVGGPQQRLDGTPADDTYRYFTSGDDLIGYLPLDDKPGELSRFIRCIAGQPQCLTYGMALLGDVHGHVLNAGIAHNLRDLRLEGGSQGAPYGAALWIGGSLGGFVAERCTLTGGAFGVQGLTEAANYPMLLRDCTLRGHSRDGYVGELQTVSFTGLTTVQYPARDGFRLRGCNTTIDGLFISEAGPECETYLRVSQGGALVVRNFTFDTESNPSPTLAGVLAERGPDMPGTRLVLDEGVLDGVKPDAPLIMLRDAAPQDAANYKKATLSVRGLRIWRPNRPGPVVQTDGPSWSGTLEDTLGLAGTPRVENLRVFGTGFEPSKIRILPDPNPQAIDPLSP
jgi:hypothetical protein